MILVYRFLVYSIGLFLSFQSIAQVNSPLNNTNVAEPSIKSKEEKVDSLLKNPYQTNSYQAKDKVVSYESVKRQYDSSYDSYSTNPSRRSLTEQEKTELTGYLDVMSKLDPKNWLNLLAYYQIGQHDISRYEVLEKVENQKTKDKDLINQVISYDAITSNETRLREDLVQLKKTSFYRSDMYDYAEDVLLSCEENSVLITHGFEDTHTALYVQKVVRKKKNVEIIDLDWFNSSFYRTVLEGKGYKIPASNMVDVSFLRDFCALNANRQIHLALTLGKPYLNAVLGSLYVQGLTFRYSPLTLELSAKNEALFSTELTKKILGDCKSPLSVNYLPFLYQLRQTESKEENSSYKKKTSYNAVSGEYDYLIQRIVTEQKLPASLKK